MEDRGKGHESGLSLSYGTAYASEVHAKRSSLNYPGTPSQSAAIRVGGSAHLNSTNQTTFMGLLESGNSGNNEGVQPNGFMEWIQQSTDKDMNAKDPCQGHDLHRTMSSGQQQMSAFLSNNKSVSSPLQSPAPSPHSMHDSLKNAQLLSNSFLRVTGISSSHGLDDHPGSFGPQSGLSTDKPQSLGNSVLPSTLAPNGLAGAGNKSHVSTVVSMSKSGMVMVSAQTLVHPNGEAPAVGLGGASVQGSYPVLGRARNSSVGTSRLGSVAEGDGASRQLPTVDPAEPFHAAQPQHHSTQQQPAPCSSPSVPVSFGTLPVSFGTLPPSTAALSGAAAATSATSTGAPNQRAPPVASPPTSVPTQPAPSSKPKPKSKLSQFLKLLKPSSKKEHGPAQGASGTQAALTTHGHGSMSSRCGAAWVLRETTHLLLKQCIRH